MSDENKDHWVSRIRSRKPYQSVYGESKSTETRTSMDWKVLAGSIFIILIVVAGIYVAVRSIEPQDGWMDLVELRAASDEAYFYIFLRTSGEGEPDWSTQAYRIALDTYDADRGSRTLPAPLQATAGSGIEFLVDIPGPTESRVLVVEGYDPFFGDQPIFSSRDPGLGFRPLRVPTNRERFSREGRRFPARSVERGRLQFDEQETRSTLTDLAVGEGFIEIRIPWAILNVTDPSSRTVIHSLDQGRTEIGVRRTEGFRIYAYSFSLQEGEWELMDRAPSGGGEAPVFHWSGWDQPTYRFEPKNGLEYVAEAMQAIPENPATPETSASLTGSE